MWRLNALIARIRLSEGWESPDLLEKSDRTAPMCRFFLFSFFIFLQSVLLWATCPFFYSHPLCCVTIYKIYAVCKLWSLFQIQKGRWDNVCVTCPLPRDGSGVLRLSVLQVIEQQPLVPYFPNPTWGGRGNVLRPEVGSLGRSGCIWKCTQSNWVVTFCQLRLPEAKHKVWAKGVHLQVPATRGAVWTGSSDYSAIWMRLFEAHSVHHQRDKVEPWTLVEALGQAWA